MKLRNWLSKCDTNRHPRSFLKAERTIATKVVVSVRLQVLAAAHMKITVSRDTAPCKKCTNVSEVRAASIIRAMSGGGSTHLWNVGLLYVTTWRNVTEGCDLHIVSGPRGVSNLFFTELGNLWVSFVLGSSDLSNDVSWSCVATRQYCEC
jgi:hypothetical protein